MKVVAMTFDPTAQKLLCITVNRTIVIIPIYFIMLRKQESVEYVFLSLPVILTLCFD
jgi:hypothetical protein